LAKTAAGTIVETPAQLLFWRVATDITQAEPLYPAALRIPVEACRSHAQFLNKIDTTR